MRLEIDYRDGSSGEYTDIELYDQSIRFPGFLVLRFKGGRLYHIRMTAINRILECTDG